MSSFLIGKSANDRSIMTSHRFTQDFFPQHGASLSNSSQNMNSPPPVTAGSHRGCIQFTESPSTSHLLLALDGRPWNSHCHLSLITFHFDLSVTPQFHYSLFYPVTITSLSPRQSPLFAAAHLYLLHLLCSGYLCA